MRRALVAIIVILALPALSASESLEQPTPQDVEGITVTVDARHPWIDSGLLVRKGQRLSFKAGGTIHWGSQADQVVGPDGRDAKPGKLGHGGLIGRVGYNGKPFAIGSAQTLVMPKDGKLFLGINDFIFGDNTGAFAVTVTKSDRP